ncbi:xanthine dehydrogenase family protein molybdopterin-binding subunit [Chengkuizengella axinellae]|uniref:Xanthine dehydrogenase family protein molybdopterin-binding subunit n=1 Tax=Chengkuizengella axinellae TaxID=3064388 RepID=A0ABT9J3R5_9BACL|nr:xanthine dehydrogenase family protein molybdopterin-binding subunit [Chengkuizengella sp. 2205SS18-9]MDP5276246.1 xanthine dehydrogenase family protein molybdopterin-binding subunit [Chengkuizengella sp. 2205SS18-9]
METIGKSIIRKEALDKVTGTAKYTSDHLSLPMLHAKMVISPYAHANITHIDLSEAWKIPGVRAILAGEKFPLTGEEIRDRPPIAYDKVRYCGEVVAVIVADSPAIAKRASSLIKVNYEPLPVVNSPNQAYENNAPVVHENIDSYERIKNVYPEVNTNIANRTKIRKGDMELGWQRTEIVVEADFSFSPSDHAAMETRCVIAEIREDETVVITSSSQSPFMIKKLLHVYFHIDIGKIVVNVPLVGGAYGGKASVQLELIAYLASKAVHGRKVKILNSREEDLITSPVHIGLDATIKLGCSRDGVLQAAEILYLFDGGAYSDKAVDISRAGAVDCTGPYRINNIQCDALCMYTNHPYAAPFRGFGHSEVMFVFERTMDMLAKKLKMDPIELRLINAIKPGDTTPTQLAVNKSNVGNVSECILKLKKIMNWDEGSIKQVSNTKVRSKGICCTWKNSTIDPDASSGVTLTFNPDGSINIISGVVEIGTGTKSVLAQMLAEKLKMDVRQIYVQMEVNTKSTPDHWKTVSSRGSFMAGRALLNAADDIIRQLKDLTACILRCSKVDLEVGLGKVYLKDTPDIFLNIKDICYGYMYPNGNAIGGQIIGRGTYIQRRVTYLDPETGAGNPGPEWTVAAQGIELEFDLLDYTYNVIRAATVVDVGKVLNEKTALGQIIGGMSMGISFAGRETFQFDQAGRILNPQLRTYRPLRYGEHPKYEVEFVETPVIDGPYGARSAGEHGLIGMPAALANSLSAAAEVDLNQLPLIPELIWKTKEGAVDDSL